MNRQQKGDEIKRLAEKFQRAKALLFAENRGLKAGEIAELRKKLTGESIGFRVVKNRLVQRMLKDVKMAGLETFFTGPTTVASSEKDPALLAKRLVEFAKDHETLKLKGGFMEGVLLSVNQIKALAALPSREELYAKLLGCLQNPARGVVNVLAAIPRQLVTVLEALKKQKT